MKKLIIPILLLCVLFSCGEEEKKGKRRKRMDVSEIKSSLNLTEQQETEFDAIVKKYDEMREASRGVEGVDRATRMAQFRELMKKQSEEIQAILNDSQKEIFAEFAKKMSRFGRSGYSDELVEQIKSSLALDNQQSKMLVAINSAFEKSYANAHDFYHGNGELAKEYWNKYDLERRKALKDVFSEEQYTKYLEIVNEYGFRGEHAEGGKPSK